MHVQKRLFVLHLCKHIIIYSLLNVLGSEKPFPAFVVQRVERIEPELCILFMRKELGDGAEWLAHEKGCHIFPCVFAKLDAMSSRFGISSRTCPNTSLISSPHLLLKRFALACIKSLRGAATVRGYLLSVLLWLYIYIYTHTHIWSSCCPRVVNE